jgi:hypothetical protein
MLPSIPFHPFCLSPLLNFSSIKVLSLSRHNEHKPIKSYIAVSGIPSHSSLRRGRNGSIPVWFHMNKVLLAIITFHMLQHFSNDLVHPFRNGPYLECFPYRRLSPKT